MRVTACCNTLLLQYESLQVIPSERTRTGWFLAGRGAASYMIKTHRLCFCAVEGLVRAMPSSYLMRKRYSCAVVVSVMLCRLAKTLYAVLLFVVNHCCSCPPIHPGAFFSPTISKSWKLCLNWKVETRHHFTTPVLSRHVVPDVPLSSLFFVLLSLPALPEGNVTAICMSDRICFRKHCLRKGNSEP